MKDVFKGYLQYKDSGGHLLLSGCEKNFRTQKADTKADLRYIDGYRLISDVRSEYLRYLSENAAAGSIKGN